MNQIKRVYTYVIFICSLLIAFSSVVNAQIIPSSADLSYQLNPGANIHIKHKVISNASKKWIILGINARNEIAFDSFIYSYYFTNNLRTPINDFELINLTNFELGTANEYKTYAFESDEADSNYLVLRVEISGTNEFYTYIINLKYVAHFFISNTISTLPFLSNYSPINTSIKISKLDKRQVNINLQFYQTIFLPSLPPMANLKRTEGFGQADAIIRIRTDSVFLPQKKGVYSIFEEGHEKSLFFLKITNKNYPQLANIDEIIEASIFLFTKKDKDKLDSSPNPKKAYDAFWLENTNSAERAGKMISAYFSRVKEANSMFATYKEGWKTDMGMIYIIFGPPNKIFKEEGSIEWIYNKTYELPNINFTFYLKDGATDIEIFELERDLKYQNTWFRAIDLWRKGKKKL